MALRTWLFLLGLALTTIGGARAEEAIEQTAIAVEDEVAIADEAAEDLVEDEAKNRDEAADSATDEPAGAEDLDAEAPQQKYELFDAMSAGVVDVTLIAKNDRQCRLIMRNTSDKPIDVRLPEAFAGVPTVLAQFGGGGGGGGLGGGGGGFGGGGGGQQAIGGGGGGLGGGGGGLGGGGGGFFSIPPEKVAKVNLPVICLDHGKKNPSSSVPYTLVPADEHIDKPEVIVLLKALGRGELHQHAAQAAVWNLNNGLSWQELAAKLQGTVRTFNRPPYFSREELQLAVGYVAEAERRAAYDSTSEVDDAADDAVDGDGDLQPGYTGDQPIDSTVDSRQSRREAGSSGRN